MSSWLLMGQTSAKQNLNDSYYVKFYKYTASVGTIHTNLQLHSDLILKRGDANRKEKKAGFLITQITFTLKDKGAEIYKVMASGDDGLFKAEIYKNGSLFFVGNLILLSTKKVLSESHPVIKLKVYDGLNRLKQFTDLSVFPTIKSPISAFVRKIFNALDFGINIKVYQNIEFDNGVYGVATRLEDYLVVKSNPTYYDLLNIMMEQFQWEVFQEDGAWKCRQIPSMRYASSYAFRIVAREINYSTGAITDITDYLNHALSFSDLAYKPTSFKCKLYSKVQSESPCYDPTILPKRYNRDGAVDWLNGQFQDGSIGWTTGAGTPEFLEGGVKLPPGTNIFQVSSTLVANQNINIKFSVTQLRVVLDATDIITDVNNPLVLVAYIASGTTYYMLNDGSGWVTATGSNTYFGLDVYGIDEYSSFADEYSSPSLEKDITINVPNAAGTIKIYLYGGGTASGNNYPKEFTQHNYCQIEITQTNNHNIAVPSKFLVSATSTVDTERTKNIKVPFSDLDPYNIHYWFYTDDYGTITYEKAKDWNTPLGNIPLTEFLVRSLLSLQLFNNHGLNIELLPGNSGSFNDIFYGNVDGEGIREYLPCYEEAKLIDDKRKFVLLEHELSSVTVDVVEGYQM